MNRNKKSIRKTVSAAAALAAAAVISCPPAVAAGITYVPIAGGRDIIVEKYLVMDREANVPNVTFSYSIAPGSGQDAEGDSIQVFAGNDTLRVSGSPSVGTAVFSPGQQTYSSVQTLPESVNTQKKSDGTSVNRDPVALTEGEQKYARSDIKVDFSGVSFREPGVYRYIITETVSDSSHGITDDADNTRIMDVYVADDTENPGNLKVEGYVLHNQESDAAVNRDGSSASEKAAGFVNQYETENLDLIKHVSGNQASHDEYFEFEVKISGAEAGTVYDIDLSNADAVTKINAVQNETKTNPAQLTAGEDGTVTQTFWLQHNQSISILGLAKNTKYVIRENKSTLDREGYRVTAAVTGDTKNGSGTDAPEAALSAASLSVEDAAITMDTSVTYTNTRTGIIPTGIIMNVIPFASVTLLGMAGAVTLTMRKKKKDQA